MDCSEIGCHRKFWLLVTSGGAVKIAASALESVILDMNVQFIKHFEWAHNKYISASFLLNIRFRDVSLSLDFVIEAQVFLRSRWGLDFDRLWKILQS